MISSFDRIDSLIEGVLMTFVKKKEKIRVNLCNPIAIGSWHVFSIIRGQKKLSSYSCQHTEKFY